MKYVIVTFLLILSSSSAFSANDRKLILEFLENNFDIQKSTNEILISKENYKNVFAMKSWNLNLSGNYTDNKLDETTGTGSSKIKNTGIHGSIGKSFFWGGNLQISTGLSDLEPNEGNKLLRDNTYYHYQKVSYSQDLGMNFLGISDRLDIDLAKTGINLSKDSDKLGSSSNLLKFYSELVQTKLKRTLITLADDAFLRMKANREWVEAKVKDGVRENADLLQARMREAEQRENVLRAKNDFEQSKSRLATLLHRDINEDEINYINIQNPTMRELPEVRWESSDEQLLLLDLVEQNELVARKIKYSYIPKITLSGTFQNNDYDVKRSDAINNARLGEDQKEFSAVISLNWSIGNKVQKNNMAIQNIKTMLAKAEYDKKKVAFKEHIKSLHLQLTTFDQELESVKKRVSLASNLVKEIKNMYKQGRASFDRLLDAENGLIATENRYANYLASRELLAIQLYYLGGTLKNVLAVNNQNSATAGTQFE